jgi:hypothetical protein
VGKGEGEGVGEGEGEGKGKWKIQDVYGSIRSIKTTENYQYVTEASVKLKFP